MKVLTDSEGQAWLASKWCGAFGAEGTASVLDFGTCYKVPNDTGRKTAIASALGHWASQSEQVALWIKDWSAFPNCSLPTLFYGFRKSLGDERTLIEAPFNVFSPTEADAVAAMEAMCLYFYWDSYLVPSDRTVIVGTSNEEFVEVYGETSNEDVREVLEILDDLGVERSAA